LTVQVADVIIKMWLDTFQSGWLAMTEY